MKRLRNILTVVLLACGMLLPADGAGRQIRSATVVVDRQQANVTSDSAEQERIRWT